MSGKTEQLGQDVDVFSMSDDELSRLDISQYLNGEQPVEDPQPAATTTTDPEPEPEPVPEEVVEPKPGEEPEPEPEPGKGEYKPQPGAKPKGKAKAEPDADPEKQTETDPAPQNVPDHKAFYEALTKPFKANGRELQITNPEEIERLHPRVPAALRHNVVELAVGLRVEFVEDDTVRVEAVFIADVGGEHLVDAAGRLVDEPFCSIQYLQAL